MSIATRDVNNLGSSKFRAGAESGTEQNCYYNRNKKYKAYKKFLAVTKETSANEIIFSIEKLIDNSNKTETIFYKTDSELKEFDNKKIENGSHKFERPIQRAGADDIVQGLRGVSKNTRLLSR